MEYPRLHVPTPKTIVRATKEDLENHSVRVSSHLVELLFLKSTRGGMGGVGGKVNPIALKFVLGGMVRQPGARRCAPTQKVFPASV